MATMKLIHKFNVGRHKRKELGRARDKGLRKQNHNRMKIALKQQVTLKYTSLILIRIFINV